MNKIDLEDINTLHDYAKYIEEYLIKCEFIFLIKNILINNKLKEELLYMSTILKKYYKNEIFTTLKNSTYDNGKKELENVSELLNKYITKYELWQKKEL